MRWIGTKAALRGMRCCIIRTEDTNGLTLRKAQAAQYENNNDQKRHLDEDVQDKSYDNYRSEYNETVFDQAERLWKVLLWI